MTLPEMIKLTLFVAILVPFVTYLTVKLSVFAFLRGKHLYEEFSKEEKRNDGEK